MIVMTLQVHLLVVFIGYNCLLGVEFIDKELDVAGAALDLGVVAVGDGGEAGQVEAGHAAQRGQEEPRTPSSHYLKSTLALTKILIKKVMRASQDSH